MKKIKTIVLIMFLATTFSSCEKVETEITMTCTLQFYDRYAKQWVKTEQTFVGLKKDIEAQKDSVIRMLENDIYGSYAQISYRNCH